MALYIRDPEVDRLVSELIEKHGLSKTEIVRRALRGELEEADAAPSLVEKDARFHTRAASAIKSGTWPSG